MGFTVFGRFCLYGTGKTREQILEVCGVTNQGGIVVIADSNATVDQRSVQLLAQRNNLNLDDAERVLMNADRWDDLPDGFMEDEEKR